MSLIKVLYNTVLDALFPISQAEQEVLNMTGHEALHTLPRAKKSPIFEACSIFSYKDERVWRLIWSIKYKKSRVAARIAGYALFQTLAMYARAAFPIIVVPMPITRQRHRERGFNQCELITDEIEKLCANIERVTIVRDLLLRTRHKSRQTLKDREERLESAHDIFEVNKKAADQLKLAVDESAAAGSNYLIIVIDDVVTTGSTIRDAVYTIRRAGFDKTFGLSVAH